MPTAARLRYLIDDAVRCNDINKCRDAYNEWLTSNCCHPKFIRIYDAHSATSRQILVPCGTCYHCRQTKINSWVTRMYAHLEDFKNAYFITLTYRSFSPNLHDAEKLVLSKLGDSAYILDSKNETNRYCYSPSLLIKKHYQNFIKRLRRYTKIDDISYVISGEYGKKYGRPHFHAILFTNHELTHYDIKRAWSVAVFRDHANKWSYKTNQSAKNGTTYYVNIGRVDFNDLVRNGSLNTGQKVKVDGNFLNAGNCFSYVCKYVCKQDSYNKQRVCAAYDQLFEKRVYTDFLHNSFDKNEAIQYLRKAGIKYNIKSLINLLKNHSYEEFIPYQGKSLYPFNFERSKVFHLPIDLFGNNSIALELIPRERNEFIDQYAPFVEFSRGTPIGCLYANRHIQEFEKGVFEKPILQQQSYVLPRYFLDKARDYVYGFRRVRKTLKGKSLALGCLPNFHRFITSSLEDVHPRYIYSCNVQNYQDLLQVLQSEKCFVDKYSGIKYIFPVNQNYVFVRGYFYDRHDRKYKQVYESDFVTFASDLLNRLNREYETYNSLLENSNKRLQQLEQSQLMLQDVGLDPLDLAEKYERKQNTYLAFKQHDYDSLHTSAE